MSGVLPRWEPRVPQALIARLYATDAAGLVDETLIDEVAYALYARCESVITVTRAEHGSVTCPQCGAVIARRRWAKEERLLCACGWELTWGEYLTTYQKQQLSGGSAIGAFCDYIARLPGAETPRERMLLIDALIHAVHKTALDGSELECWRPAACNLIEGRMRELIAFLDALAGTHAATPEVRAAQDAWRETVRPRLWGADGLPIADHSQEEAT